LSILDFPALAASLGIDAVEICQAHLESTDAEYLSGVRRAVRDAGSRVINVPIDVGNLAVAGAEQQEAEIATILPWIDAAHALGSPAVRVNTGHPDGIDEAEALSIVSAGYRRLAAYCAERDMLILLENHGGLSARPEAIMELLSAVNARNFRLCPDFGNFAPEFREEGLRRMLPHAAIVHAKVMDMNEDGTHEAFDLDRCISLVEDDGYSGPLSIEFEGKGDQLEGVTRARDYLLLRLGSHIQSRIRDT
jgi:L-ribulose-5-phosphate 3-epimerase